MPTFEPEPFDFADMRERVADGTETGAEIARELFIGESGAGVEERRFAQELYS